MAFNPGQGLSGTGLQSDDKIASSPARSCGRVSANDRPAGQSNRDQPMNLPMSKWTTLPKSKEEADHEVLARHGREPWDARVNQELPCVPVPRVNMMNSIPGYVPGVGATHGFGDDAGTLFVGSTINTGPRKPARNFDGGLSLSL